MKQLTSVVTTASILGALVFLAGPASAAEQRLEAENMQNGGGKYAVWNDDKAGVTVRSLLTNGSATGKFTAATNFTALELRAKGQLAGSDAPKVRVTLDGKTAGELSLGSSDYKSYTVSGNWTAGEHTVGIEYLNDSGDRSAVLDYVVPVGATTAPAPAAPVQEPAAPAAETADTVPAPATRDATLQPFIPTAFSNTPMGSGAKFAAEGDARHQTFQQGGANVNHERWSISVQHAKQSDPLATVTVNSGWKEQFRVPTNATTTGGTDQHMSIIQPDGRTSYEVWGMSKQSGTAWTARYIVKTDLFSDGMKAGARASGVSHLHGLIRDQELDKLSIPHTVAIGIDGNQLKSVNNRTGIWPAKKEDGDSASSYTGTIPMGTMLALPADVNIESLNLSPEGKALARALQNYGGHVLIRSSGVTIYAEQAADGEAAQRMKADWDKLRDMLRIVDNNTEANVSGGGERRAPLAAPLTQ